MATPGVQIFPKRIIKQKHTKYQRKRKPNHDLVAIIITDKRLKKM